MQTDDICLLMRKPDQRIEAELAAIPPLAVLCSLKDIVPKNAVSKSCFYNWIMIHIFLRFILKNFSERYIMILFQCKLLRKKTPNSVCVFLYVCIYMYICT